MEPGEHLLEGIEAADDVKEEVLRDDISKQPLDVTENPQKTMRSISF